MTIEISPVNESHIESFRACLDAVAREKKYIGMIEAKPLEQVREFVREIIASDAAQFVATDGATVIGWCDILPAWSHAVQHRGTLGMGILAAYRGRGIGTKLLTACIAKAQTNGITRIELEARADNIVAIKLYEKLGFVHEAKKRKGLRYEGVYFDSVQMSLLFA